MKNKNDMQTLMLGDDTIILTENADGKMYLIKSKYFQDILDDWIGGCEFVPANDAKVFFAAYNGKPINPYCYTDFESLLRYFADTLGIGTIYKYCYAEDSDKKEATEPVSGIANFGIPHEQDPYEKEIGELVSDIVDFEMTYEPDRDMLEFWDGKARVETEPIYQVYEIISNALKRNDTSQFTGHLWQIIQEHSTEKSIVLAAAELFWKLLFEPRKSKQ